MDASNNPLQQPQQPPAQLPPLLPIIATQEDGSRLEQPEEEESEPQPITEQEVGEYREQDRFLPIANVSRIMKSSVPSTAKIAKDAKECVQECVSEFISFITSEAAEKCQLEKRKTIGGEDILYAMSTLGFDNYAETLKIHLAKLRAQQHQNNTNEKSDKTDKNASSVSANTNANAGGSGSNGPGLSGSGNGNGNAKGSGSGSRGGRAGGHVQAQGHAHHHHPGHGGLGHGHGHA